MNKGLLKSWKTDKGFGFIKSDTLEHDTFIHISALKHVSRKPEVGDTIYFEVATQSDGKTKAINCRIEGVAELKVTPKLVSGFIESQQKTAGCSLHILANNFLLVRTA